MAIANDLIEILACPKCKAPVKQQGNEVVCQGSGCGLRFPIRENIPVMLIEEAKK